MDGTVQWPLMLKGEALSLCGLPPPWSGEQLCGRGRGRGLWSVETLAGDC